MFCFNRSRKKDIKHDLRNNLNHINGYTTLIMSNNDNEKIEEYCLMLQQEINNMLQVIENKLK